MKKKIKDLSSTFIKLQNGLTWGPHRRGNGLSLPRGFGEMYALNNERAVNEYEKNSRIKKKSDYLDGVCSG